MDASTGRARRAAVGAVALVTAMAVGPAPGAGAGLLEDALGMARGAPGNRPPEVDAGPIITAGAGTVALDGTVRDDGIGAPPGTLDTAWEVKSAPEGARVDIADHRQVDTTATFSHVGQYRLALFASDGDRWSGDSLVVNIAADGDVDRFLRIMPIGDSITHGFDDGHDTYRAPFWHALVGGGCVFDVVGSNWGLPSGRRSIDPSIDPDHEGHGGWRADQIAAHLEGVAHDQQANVALVHVGSNDVAQSHSMDPAEARAYREMAIANIREIVGTVRSVDPGAVVILAQIIPSLWDTEGHVAELNARIAELAAELHDPAAPVALVDMYTGFSALTDTYDGTHPDESGERIIAERFWAALQPYVGASCDRL